MGSNVQVTVIVPNVHIILGMRLQELMIKCIEKIIASIERILSYTAFRKHKNHPIIRLSRTALIRELMWAEQLLASWQDGSHNDAAMGRMEFNSRIVAACAEDLKELINE